MDAVRLSCPHCGRRYHLNIDLSELTRIRKRTQCASCGATFDVGQRLLEERRREELKPRSSGRASPNRSGPTRARTASARRLASAVRRSSDLPPPDVLEVGRVRSEVATLPAPSPLPPAPPDQSEESEQLAGWLAATAPHPEVGPGLPAEPGTNASVPPIELTEADLEPIEEPPPVPRPQDPRWSDGIETGLAGLAFPDPAVEALRRLLSGAGREPGSG